MLLLNFCVKSWAFEAQDKHFKCKPKESNIPLVLFPFKLLSNTLADMKQFHRGPPALRKFFLGHWPSFKGHISAQCPAWIFQISLQLLPLQYTWLCSKTLSFSERPLYPFNNQKTVQEYILTIFHMLCNHVRRPYKNETPAPLKALY